MMDKETISTKCPYCRVVMRPTVMKCDLCNVEVQGSFRQPVFQMMSSDDLDFLSKYMLAGFNIKALEQETGLGYAAIRTRLNRMIEHYTWLREAEEEKRHILARVASNEITASAATELIAGMGMDYRGGRSRR